MRKSMIFAAGLFLAALFAHQAYAGPYDASSVPKEEGQALKADQTGTDGKAPAKSGSSVVERDKKRYDIQKRAAERRAAEMKKAGKTRHPAKSGSSVVERDKKRYEIQKRAADRRAVEMKKAEKAKKKDAKKKEPIDAQGQTPAKSPDPMPGNGK